MGDLPGHPFRGNQYTDAQEAAMGRMQNRARREAAERSGSVELGGVRARYNPNLRSEARNVGKGGQTGKYEVGPKFFDLPDDAIRAHVLKHEEGHDLSDEMLSDGSAWRALDAGVLPSDLNGQTTPGEILAEAYAILHSEPEWLEDRHPKLAEFVKARMKK